MIIDNAEMNFGTDILNFVLFFPKFITQNIMKNTADPICVCDECGSSFLRSSSKMSGLCPECSHILYGSPNCSHVFAKGKCEKCL